MGYGTRTITELVAIENLDPLRGEKPTLHRRSARCSLDKSAEMLADQASRLQRCPRRITFVVLYGPQRCLTLAPHNGSAAIRDRHVPAWMSQRAASHPRQISALDVACVDVVCAQFP